MSGIDSSYEVRLFDIYLKQPCQTPKQAAQRIANIRFNNNEVALHIFTEPLIIFSEKQSITQY